MKKNTTKAQFIQQFPSITPIVLDSAITLFGGWGKMKDHFLKHRGLFIDRIEGLTNEKINSAFAGHGRWIHDMIIESPKRPLLRERTAFMRLFDTTGAGHQMNMTNLGNFEYALVNQSEYSQPVVRKVVAVSTLFVLKEIGSLINGE